ncbi:MAG: hypothetical protein OES79_06520 [Planctomycetota bacterium]|nr:hypothetical protein [Planctomycetota bacterium]
MKKVLLACLGAFCLLTASAFADEGLPSTSVLDDMGLSGMQILSDTDALAVRGMGPPKLTAKKPWVAVGGNSHASIPGFRPVPALDGDGKGHVSGTARSSDWYKAAGKYYAAGGSESVADYTTKHTTIRRYNRHKEVNTSIHSQTYYSAGKSWGKAF